MIKCRHTDPPRQPYLSVDEADSAAKLLRSSKSLLKAILSPCKKLAIQFSNEHISRLLLCPSRMICSIMYEAYSTLLFHFTGVNDPQLTVGAGRRTGP